MDYRQALAYIDSYTDYEKTPMPHAAAHYDVRRLVELMGYFDDLHLKTRAVHITGTKGKGSVAAMVASVLTADGYTTGLYTSPHLLTLRERVRIGDDQISEAELVKTLEQLKPAMEEVNRRATYGRLTTFELLTALAFLYFAEKRADFQVLEVGMGGTYDATNIIQHPEVCVITSISYDHVKVLGNTLTSIAAEKCGIIKPGCIVVTSPQREEAIQVIRDFCTRREAKLIEVGRDVTWRGGDFTLSSQQLVINGRRDSYDVTIPLLGEHQMENAATAVAALEVLIERGFSINKDSIVKGLAKVNWPGRFQIIGHRPLFVLDGAHNQNSAEKLSRTIERYLPGKKAVLVIGVSSDKNIAGIADILAPVTDKVVITRSKHPRSMAPERIVAEFARLKIPAEIANGVPAAVSRAVTLAGENGMVCVTGSLFLVAEALEIADQFARC